MPNRLLSELLIFSNLTLYIPRDKIKILKLQIIPTLLNHQFEKRANR